jgi:hypothetical protein
MLKKVFFCLLIILPYTLTAQRFKGGVLLGINACQIDGDDWSGYNKAGLLGGVYVNTQLAGKWKGQFEIKYASKGSASPKYYANPIKFRLRYIELPVLACYNAYKHLDIQGGLSFGYLFSAARSDAGEYREFDEIPKRTETALNIGVNYSLLDRVDINVRYSYSLLPIYENYVGASYGNGAWFNNVFMFGFYFKLGSKR